MQQTSEFIVRHFSYYVTHCVYTYYSRHKYLRMERIREIREIITRENFDAYGTIRNINKWLQVGRIQGENA